MDTDNNIGDWLHLCGHYLRRRPCWLRQTHCRALALGLYQGQNLQLGGVHPGPDGDCRAQNGSRRPARAHHEPQLTPKMVPLGHRYGQRVTAHGLRGDTVCPVSAGAGAVGPGSASREGVLLVARDFGQLFNCRWG